MTITDVQFGESVYATIDGVAVEFLEPLDEPGGRVCDCCGKGEEWSGEDCQRAIYASYEPLNYTICSECLKSGQ